MKHSRKHRAMHGMSLVEVLIVTAISLTISAAAIPKVFTTLANVELRGAAHSSAGLMQNARMLAIRDAKYRKAKYYNGTGGGIVYVDVNDNGTSQSTEPQVQMGTTVFGSTAPTGMGVGAVTALTATELNFTPVTTTAVMFSPIGQPCSAIGTCSVGMVVYLKDTRTMGAPGWSAVSISPAGRVVTWMWDGSAWKQV
jgi:prepilin-type N-terminal cleavage/methylation domain-containing protein